MNRRGFMSAILAAAIAPAIVKAANLMPVRMLDSGVIVLYGDGVHDDSAALQAWCDGGRRVVRPDGSDAERYLSGESLKLSQSLHLRAGQPFGTMANCELHWPESIASGTMIYGNYRPTEAMIHVAFP